MFPENFDLLLPKSSHPLNSVLCQASKPMPGSTDQEEASKIANQH